MKRIEVTNVKEYSLNFKDWRNDENIYASLTEWCNGEGYNISFIRKSDSEKIELTREEIDAIIMLYTYSNIYFGR